MFALPSATSVAPDASARELVPDVFVLPPPTATPTESGSARGQRYFIGASLFVLALVFGFFVSAFGASMAFDSVAVGY